MKARTRARIIWLPIITALAAGASLLLWADGWAVRGFGGAGVLCAAWLIVNLATRLILK